MRKIRATMIVLLCISALSPVLSQTMAVQMQSPLEIAKEAAAWVMSQAVPKSGGYMWMYYWISQGFYSPTLSDGASGIGEFFLSLYKKTGDRTYLDYAKGAATWIISNASSADGGYRWPFPNGEIPHPGWYLPRISLGAAGIGEFLLELYKETHDSLYLQYAEGAARWMINLANQSVSKYGQYYIMDPAGATNTDYQSGQAGFGAFFLHLYQLTSNDTYLTYAKRFSDWLLTKAEPENGGYKWEDQIDHEIYHIGQSTGSIATWLYELYGVTRDPRYLNYAEGGIQWILSKAIVSEDTCKWPATTRDTSGTIFDDWGAPISTHCTVGEILLNAYAATSNSTYLDYAIEQTNWIIEQAVPENEGYRFPASEGSSEFDAYINSQVYRVLCLVHSKTQNETAQAIYSQYAVRALKWISDSAEHDQNGLKWETNGFGNRRYHTTLNHGASGIGYNLIIAPTINTQISIRPSIKLSGETEYLSTEDTNVTILAQLTDADTLQPMVHAVARITIYSPDASIQTSDQMTEIRAGIYKWESNETVHQIYAKNGKGVYTAIGEVTSATGENASDSLEFRIDSPPDNIIEIAIAGSIVAVVAFTALTLFYVRRKRKRRPIC